MAQFHVTYFYLATGMEGRPDYADYGVVSADNEEEAKYIAAKIRYPKMSKQDIDWTIGCLTAKRVS